MSARPTVPRLLTIMGSGETSPTMVKVHRQLLGRLGPPPVPAVLLDTPFCWARRSFLELFNHFAPMLEVPMIWTRSR